jgi:uncharacterized protein (DUF885 family)
MHDLLSRADMLPPEALSYSQRIDRKLAEGFLRIQCWEFASGRFHQGNPSVYCGEAIFGVMSLFLSDFAPLAQRVAAATDRLHGVADLLRQGRDNISASPQAWVRHALDECDGALAFLGDDALLAAGDNVTDAYRSGVRASAQAFREFRAYLDGELLAAGTRAAGCGEEAFALHLGQAHFLDQDADEIAACATAELEAAAARLAERCTDFGETDPRLILKSLGAIHPHIDEYYGRYQQTWNAMRALAAEHALLTWPDFPLRYVPFPAWVRRAAPALYFLNYRSPAAFNRPPMHDYLVTPIDAALPPDELEALLQANDDSNIKLNHVVHHGGIGHHIQNWHAFRAKSRVGRMAAVDCAARIAMQCAGTMAEGWACYATDLIAEHGGVTPLEEFAEIHTRVRMCARAIVDIKFHQGEFSFAQAAQFYEQKAGMSPAAARYEVTRNSMYPGSAVIYVTGCDAIHDLRKELSVARGNAFNLQDFHDEFLSFGSIPVALIADAMREAQNHLR